MPNNTNKSVVCFYDDDRGWHDCYFVSYNPVLCRRSNLRRVRKIVSKLPHVARVHRCYVVGY